MRKIRVGFSVLISDPKDNLWANGIKQNTISLQETFSLAQNVEKSYLVNLGSLHDYAGTSWEPFSDKIITPQQALDKIDVLITAMATPPESLVDSFSKKNIPFIKHSMGNEYAIFSEQILFMDQAANNYNKRKNYKAVWISPHFFKQNKDFFEVITDAPASIGPYIWSPKFLDQQAERNKKINGKSLYEPSGNTEKRVSTFEPNLNLLKTCMTPMLITEKFYKKAPDLLKKASIFGTERIKTKSFFIKFAKDFESYKNKKMFFESRYPMAWALLEHTDIVIAHQRDLELNYAYFDAAWLGFPVLHNSDMLKDLGYYYPDWDAEAASDILIDIAKNFDSNYEEYRDISRKIISRYLWDHPDNVNGYAELLEKALS